MKKSNNLMVMCLTLLRNYAQQDAATAPTCTCGHLYRRFGEIEEGRLWRYMEGGECALDVTHTRDDLLCATLEPPLYIVDAQGRRCYNMQRRTCIPEGRYEVVMSYSPRFTRRLDSFVPALRDVPCRSAILIHPGNSVRDTEGCILLGTEARDAAGTPCLTDSRQAVLDLIAGIDAFRDMFPGSRVIIDVADAQAPPYRQWPA